MSTYRDYKVGDKVISITKGRDNVGTITEVTLMTVTIRWSFSTQKISFFTTKWTLQEEYGITKSSH